MRFTAENAAELGSKGGVISGIAKREAKEERKLAREHEALAIALIQSYEGRTLARVRVQLDKLYEAFMNEIDKEQPDAAKLDRIASAQARLADQEQKLAGRPNPGSLKPTTSKPTRHAQVEPTESSQPIRQPDPNG